MIRIVVAVLTVVGAFLTLGGLVWGARRLKAEHQHLDQGLREVERIARDTTLDDAEQNRQRQTVLPVTSTFGDMEYFREWVRFSILDQAVDNLREPAWLTGTGVILVTVASVWSLWL